MYRKKINRKNKHQGGNTKKNHKIYIECVYGENKVYNCVVTPKEQQLKYNIFFVNLLLYIIVM